MDKQKTLLGHDGLQSSEWSRRGHREWARRKVFGEFTRWAAELRDSRLAEKAGRLWQMLLDGGLRRADMAVAIGALLYCITPIDLSPDVIPVLGYVDDLLMVVSVLSYLGGSARR